MEKKEQGQEDAGVNGGVNRNAGRLPSKLFFVSRIVVVVAVVVRIWDLIATK